MLVNTNHLAAWFRRGEANEHSVVMMDDGYLFMRTGVPRSTRSRTLYTARLFLKRGVTQKDCWLPSTSLCGVFEIAST
jgi:hypothetical protein